MKGERINHLRTFIRLAEVFEVKLDYLAFELQGQSSKLEVKDKELLR